MLSVVICTYNRAGALDGALRSLMAIHDPPGETWELVIVDNNSTDDTPAAVERLAAGARVPVRYVFEPEQGVGHARNRGAREARGEWVVYTDDDVEFHRDWLANLYRTMRESGPAAIGGRVMAVWPSDARPAWLVESGPYRTPGGAIPQYDLGEQGGEAAIPPITANAAIHRSLFQRHGLFRADLAEGISMGEDTEFFERVRAAGEKVLYAPGAVVYHPVPMGRLSKKYFSRWSFNAGRAALRIQAPPAAAKRYFGVPRYYLKNLAALAPRWLTAYGEGKRFHYWMRMCGQAGQIMECRAQGRQR
ncbi:MAG: glycosyltransferase family 2 protein [Bryobacterales bacterium]|nr:glycosyltransferase family 2 protein [Bryobacterales bacterium]